MEKREKEADKDEKSKSNRTDSVRCSVSMCLERNSQRVERGGRKKWKKVRRKKKDIYFKPETSLHRIRCLHMYLFIYVFIYSAGRVR